mmetsp:Transcript_2758/g.4109  ORF Transcript_2758/g.4109 Transcript_2758/m.4109 type:complete len:628 (+) Transcript_2758:127-2010(+)
MKSTNEVKTVMRHRYLLCLVLTFAVVQFLHHIFSLDEEKGGGVERQVQRAAMEPSCSNDVTNRTTVGSVCRCLSRSANGSLPYGIWNHAYVQKSIREAARASVFDCWSWDGVIDDVNKTEAWIANITDHMLHLLNVHRLKKSIKTRANPLVLERIFQVILRRLADPIHNPPLKIAVFGGSVTAGFRSRANSMGLRENVNSDVQCTWAYKLEGLLNKIFLGGSSSTEDIQPAESTKKDMPLEKVVVVKNYAVDGTDSTIGTTMLEYNLFGSDMSEYDIFIPSFGANDIQAPKGLVRNILSEDMQKFNRLAKAQRPCNDLPLVMQLDDILGDSQLQMVREGLRYSREMVATTSWAGFSSVSYADAVRDFVYANPSDSTLHEFGQLHPGFNFHTGVAWVLAYNFLEGMVDACDAGSLPEHDKEEPRAGFPPPMLRDDLRTEEVLSIWKMKAEENSQLCAENITGVSCVYSYIASYLGANNARQVRRAIAKVATNIQGWEAIGNPVKKPRRTWVANGFNSTFTIQLNDFKMPINRMLILFIKSYGPKWKDSQLEVVVDGKENKSSWKNLKHFYLSGEHNTTTSINYSHRVDLEDFLQAGSSVRVTFTLVGGNTFQINGIALCHDAKSIDYY